MYSYISSHTYVCQRCAHALIMCVQTFYYYTTYLFSSLRAYYVLLSHNLYLSSLNNLHVTLAKRNSLFYKINPFRFWKIDNHSTYLHENEKLTQQTTYCTEKYR